MAQINISDIAKLAGVSKSTVSRVLNGASDVKEATRDKVLQTMKEAGYTPSATARALSKRVSDTIGIIIPEIDNPFFGRVLRGIIDEVDPYNLSVFCCNTDDNEEKDLKALDLLMTHQVRGLIYDPAIDAPGSRDMNMLKKKLKLLDVPIVQIDRSLDGIDTDSLVFADKEAIHDTVKALIDAGHQKIAILNAGDHLKLARLREQGYLDAMHEAGLPIDERYRFHGDMRFAKAYELAKHMLNMPDRPTAVITCNNNTTLGLVNALHDNGESLHAITWVGLDLIDALDLTHSGLNFIKRDAYELGRQAAHMLINRFAFPDAPVQHVQLQPELLLRNLAETSNQIG